MTNTNITTLRFLRKRYLSATLYCTEIKGIEQCKDNYPIKLNNIGSYTTCFSTGYNSTYLLILA